ncbi:MAG: methyl-accepting chemotaxis protein [Nitrospirota bacterium]
MATAATPTQSNVDRRDGFFIHQIQKGYAIWIGLLLFLYSALFFTLAFYGAHLKPMLALYGSDSLEERQVASAEMLMLSETVWVAVPVLFFGSVIFSLIITRRIAGPLYRLDESIQQWGRGNLRWRIQFRPSDQLDELEGTTNQAFQNIEQSFAKIQHQTQSLLAALSKIEQAGSSGIKEAQDAMEEIAAVLQRFDFRSLSETRVKIR